MLNLDFVELGIAGMGAGFSVLDASTAPLFLRPPPTAAWAIREVPVSAILRPLHSAIL